MKNLGLVLLLLAIILMSGCQGLSSEHTSGPRYRTISTEPLRDTEAAKQANEKGLGYLQGGNLDQAAKAFEEALTADVKFGPAHNNLGKVYYRQNDLYKAAWEFEYARDLLPKHPEPRNNLGLVLEKAGELDRAVKHYREAVALAPETIEYRANLCRALIRQGERTPEVRKLLEAILAEDNRPEWLIWARKQQQRPGL